MSLSSTIFSSTDQYIIFFYMFQFRHLFIYWHWTHRCWWHITHVRQKLIYPAYFCIGTSQDFWTWNTRSTVAVYRGALLNSEIIGRKHKKTGKKMGSDLKVYEDIFLVGGLKREGRMWAPALLSWGRAHPNWLRPLAIHTCSCLWVTESTAVLNFRLHVHFSDWANSKIPNLQ